LNQAHAIGTVTSEKPLQDAFVVKLNDRLMSKSELPWPAGGQIATDDRTHSQIGWKTPSELASVPDRAEISCGNKETTFEGGFIGGPGAIPGSQNRSEQAEIAGKQHVRVRK
jgi:hypothetical protein